MDISPVIGMAITLVATGATETREGIEAFLTQFMKMLAPSATGAWSEIFKLLGRQHPGPGRFLILDGAFLAIMGVDDPINWLIAWLRVISAAEIHPISMPLCALNLSDGFRRATLDAYNYCFPDATKFPMIILDEISLLRGPIDTVQIELPPHSSVANLVSSVDLKVGERSPGTVRSIGSGWCVHGLRFLEMPSLMYIDSNFIVLNHLYLFGVKNIRTIGDGSRVGGFTMVLANNKQGWSSARHKLPKGNWETGVGIRMFGRDMSWRRSLAIRIVDEGLKDPIILPDSLGYFEWFWY